MDTNIVGLLVSFVFLGGVIVFGWLLARFTSASGEIVRKTVHIGVSNWWFIEMTFFNHLAFALVGPVVFIVANALFTFKDLGASLGFGERKRNYGLVYFPVSLLVLVLLQYFGVLSSVACAVGVLVMGYGDGFAAIVGSRIGHHGIPLPTGGKTYEGTAVMFLVSTAVTLLCLVFATHLSVAQILSIAVLIGAVSAIVEAITPLGLDNITVPLIGSFLAGVFL